MDVPEYVEKLRRPVPRQVQVVARDSLRTFGRLTAGSRPLPDYLIIGSKKGGTTSLTNWLGRHPHVGRMFPSAQRLKSAHYFDINYARGPDWYRSHFPTNRSRRVQERRVNGTVIVGEASPYYMFHPAAAGRVLETVPHVKAIALLRDPVARAYSNYWDRRATGTEELPTFEAAIEAEEQRLADVDHARLLTDPSYYSFDHDNHAYLARGRYLEHLRPWMEALPPEQLLILRAETMFEDPYPVFARVQEFLEIPVVDSITLSKYNERPREAMDPVTVQRLAEYYRPHNRALYEALGEDFHWESRYFSS